MADVTDPANPLITTAASATVVNDKTQELLMRLRDGVRMRRRRPAGAIQYLNIHDALTCRCMLSQQSDVHLGAHGYRALRDALSALLLQRIHGPDGKRFLIELHNRFAFPGGLPGADAGGRAAGRGIAPRRQELRASCSPFCWSFVYYFLSSTGIALGRQNKLPAFLAVWSANLLFAVAGNVSAVADGDRGAHPERHFCLDCARRRSQLQRTQAENGFRLSGISRQA